MRSDETLMQAVGEGDLAAFEELVLAHQGAAWQVAYRFIGDAAEAEDIAQQAFLKTLEAAPRYKPTASFRTYFTRILTRLCIDYRRKKRPVLVERPPDLAQDSPSPLQQLSLDERDGRIQAAMDALPADYRMVVVLRYFQGLSGREMADAMGRSVKAVERLLARAKSVLEPQLKPLQQP